MEKVGCGNKTEKEEKLTLPVKKWTQSAIFTTIPNFWRANSMNKEQFAEYSKQYFASLPSLGKSELTVISYERTHRKFYEWLDNNEEIKPIHFLAGHISLK